MADPVGGPLEGAYPPRGQPPPDPLATRGRRERVARRGRSATVRPMDKHTGDRLAALMAETLADADGHATDTPSLQLRARYSVRPTLDGRQMLERIAP